MTSFLCMVAIPPCPSVLHDKGRSKRPLHSQETSYTLGGMDRFPEEFDDLLTPRGRRLLGDPPQLEALLAKKQTPIVVIGGVMQDGIARECIRLLDEAMFPSLQRMYTRIP